MRFNTIRLLLLVSALCWPGSPAFAWEAVEPDGYAAWSAYRVPSATTVIYGAEIERRGYGTLRDAARWTPEIRVTDIGPRGGGVYGGAASRTVRALGAGVPAYWGDVPIAFDPRLLDVERVEVLSGPQGVSDGLGAMAGVVRYLPRKPDTERQKFEMSGEGFLRARGADPGADLGLVANLPMADGRLAMRVSFGVFHDPGFIDYGHLIREPGASHPEPAAGAEASHLYREADADTERTLSARLSLLWKATEDIEIVLSHQTQDLQAGGYRATHARAYGTSRYESARRYTEPVDRTDRLWSLDAGWNLGPAKLTTTLGHTRWSAEGRRDQTDFLLRYFGIDGLLPGSPAGADLSARPCSSANPSPFCAFSAFTRDERDVEGLHATLRLASTGQGPWGWMAAASWHDVEAEGTGREFAPGLSRSADADPSVPQDLEYLSKGWSNETRRALFGTLSRRIGESLRLFVGARCFEIDEESGASTEFPFTPEFSSPYRETRNSHSGTLFEIGAAYRLGDDRLFYVTRAEGGGASAGGSNNFRVCSPEDIAAGEAGNQPSCIYEHQKRFKPDATVNYEVGLRGSWLDGRVAANGSLFHTEWKDAQMSGRTPFSKQGITQNTDARSRGLHLALALHPTESFLLRGFWSYFRAELTEDAPGLLPEGADAFKGDRTPGAPEHRAGVIVSKSMRLSDNIHLELSHDYAWVGSVLTRIGGREGGERLPGYGVHGLSASLSSESSAWTATLYVENLLDEYAVVSRSGTPMDIRTADGFTLRSYASHVLPPRRAGLRFRYVF